MIPKMKPVHEVAKRLGTTTDNLVTSSRAGGFPPVVKINRTYFVPIAAVLKWIERGGDVSEASSS